ncbi:MAG: hypothetical protein KAV87_17410 [Desulfobacteraceae bacterium]|nr:hypothetical protein [Desulfobacteraceae bacterium]
MPKQKQIWACKIGEVDLKGLPKFADGPMRVAVENAYHEITGEWPNFLFSGWDDELTDEERVVADNL